MLSTRRLQLLVALARTGSIAGAAAAAGCSAAAASQQLSALERETGADLLERSARSVRLTGAGELLADRARVILAELEAAERDLALAGTTGGGRLRVGSFATATRPFAAPALGALRRRHPGMRISFTEVEPEAALDAVRAGELDVAVTHHYPVLAAPDTHGLRQVAVCADPLLLAVPAHLARSDSTAADVRDFAGADWISTRPDRGFQALTELTAEAAGFRPRITGRTVGYVALLDLVAAGLGVALVPELAAAPRPGLRLLDIVAPAGLSRTVELTSRAADRSPAVSAFHVEVSRRVPRAATAIRKPRGGAGSPG
ncbi:LysR substrate-binding domain-containing protein [Amycolatopsis lexingtonensis]|uniref:LysR substrate-binding domain-containing protein n=1 Tax=Amycolatopsis lexingtonensis TaxID=218822 RepID=UPI003F6F371D